MKYLATLLITFSFVVATVAAHDASQHKGKATEGEITAINGDSIELKTAAGNVRVSLNAKTKIEHGTEAVDRSHLKSGERVSVFGTKLPGGELVAKEIVIPAAGAAHHSTSKKTTSSPKPKP
jgi:hypothetical protein